MSSPPSPPDGMVAPSYWIDPKTGNNYMVTVQYANHVINHMTMEDFENIPLRGARPTGYDPMQEGREASDVGGDLFYGGHTQAIPRCARWRRSNRSIPPQRLITTRSAA